jgi:thiol-disulfide isomerase/thioredoxin
MRARFFSTALLIAIASTNVFACPGCKEAINGQGGFFASGFNWSIVFMLGVFGTLLGTVCYKIFRIIQRETAATSRDPEAVHASGGHWMAITLPICGVGIAVLMIMGSVNAVSKTQDSATSEQSVKADIAKSRGPLLITFKSESCSICKQMKPVLDNLASEYDSKLNMLYVNAAESKNLVREYNVDDLPCSVFVKEGKEVARLAGLCSEAEFKSWVDERLK